MAVGSLTTHLEDSTSILLVAPPSDPADDRACTDLLTFDDPERENVLSVTLSQTPADRLALWRQEGGGAMPNRAVIVDGSGPSTEAERATVVEAIPDLSVEVLSDAAGPMELALIVGQYLGEWDDTAERTVACIHSLSALLDSFARGEVVQFVNALDARLESAGAVVHYHLDPGAHDDSTLSEIRPLFDAVVEHVPDDGWTVTKSAADSPQFRGESSALYPERSGTERPSVDRPLDDVFELLANERRRRTLYALAQTDVLSVSIDRLADEVVERERAGGAVSGPLHNREVTIALAHNHLPRLADAGLVAYDHESGAVTKREFGDGFAAFVRYVDRIDRP
ncbi:DUF7504 family protein [Natronoarchaeum rubrum]|uniref:DUF7504 family protein n=1 Tax=Natronoarchaeum rubrum TaxID=755311 RepID=UPI002113598F|nr:hypothetical protein [Natronoarchaeum rubrum]